MSQDDENIIRLFSDIAVGNKEAYASVFNRYYDRVFGFAMRYCKIEYLAEDITQQVFIILWERRAELTQIKAPEAWLRVLARNQTGNVLKKEAVRKRYRTYVAQLFEEEKKTPLQQLISKQNNAIIERAINSLTPRQQEVFKMSRFQAATYAEIADYLGISKETVKEHMAGALKTIRAYLSEMKKDIFMLLLLLAKYFF
ncbi:MAG: RNA polymerase sigma-70 factor [Niabella sp.]